ncbi:MULTISPECIES: hypothetical protein [Cellulosimicrobium]|uniref:DUF4129 domain-containing protein n=1 Tax=Cellulosimicrobium sp. ES-005 TaxID=3163031 RepID=A0AAU8FW12_9MICO|nr:hypothetical protein [Cellulosimicrobium cellulans]MCO7273755.1 hypothetical protein [Cellulosimicrobium cellulans]
MPVDELVDPVGYSGWWTVLGIVLILAAAAVVFLVIWLTRASAAEKAVPPPAPRLPTGPYDPYASLRAEYERRLDVVAERFRAGELDERALHLALSAEMRGFATGRLGQDASSMTLSEIQQIGEAGRLTQVIARYYRPSFADHDNDPAARATDAEDSIDRARSVVRGW